ncbi:V-set and transmembrane domain-containing protein 1-like [Sarcophilus harrisii]|uniref:Ig-like domain-containing protein n=1 Tax=Sarcophilus harrisii TaxID=9305 RepID=A0A7N4P7A5_SARHA|nr:V-set and transmembrane domain-containing protein 1-like [Sarcophilus harrisii]
MSSTVASLLCLGLCLGQKIPSAEGFFSKPSLLVRPGILVAAGETVTFTCQIFLASGISKLTFFLLKAGVPDPLQFQSTEEKVANFTLPSVKAEDAGNYSCIYLVEGRRRASDPSEVLKLEVTDEKDTDPQREDEKNTHPQKKDLRAAMAVTVTCFFIFSLLCALFCRCPIPHKSSHGDTPRSPSDNTGVSQSVSLPTEKIIYEDISKGRQIETQASESEDPHGVTYSQLNTAALSEGQRVPTSTAPEPCIYSTVALH